MSNQFTFNHIIQKVNNRFDIIKYISFIYFFYMSVSFMMKDCKNSGNFDCCCSHWFLEFVLGPCFQILLLMPFIVQHLAEKEGWLLRFNVVWLSVFCVPSSWSRQLVCSL